jgi:hypothetical protein
MQPVQTVVGIDVGGEMKGFHAVALQGYYFVDKNTEANPSVIVDWCLAKGAMVVVSRGKGFDNFFVNWKLSIFILNNQNIFTGKAFPNYFFEYII